MKRVDLIKKLVAEGMSEKTLANFNDKQINELAQRLLGEMLTTTVADYQKSPALQQMAKTPNTPPIKITNEEKPSAGLSKEKKSEVVKKAKKGGDIGKKGKGFEKLADKAAEKYGSKEKGEKVAAAAMWKNIKREQKEIKNWVNALAEQNFHSFTSKNEIMELISSKLNENAPASPKEKPGTDTPVREKPTEKPGKPKRENPFEPKHTPKPKAMGEGEEQNKSVPQFLKFKNLGIKFKDSK